MGKIIGITTKISRSKEIKRIKNDHLTGIDLVEVSSDYPNAISDNNGIPMLIPILQTYDRLTIRDIIQNIDGLLLTGGEDIDPKIYHQEYIEANKSALMKIDIERDSFEMALLKEAFKSKVPILGICRGHQLINVCFGGSLFQDIERHLNTEIDHLGSLDNKTKLIHSVNLKKDSVLNEIFDTKKLEVNSFHHQCIDQLAENFESIATSDDQIVEGIVYKGDQWILGIQWHPEMLYKKYNNHGKLFERFIQVVNKKANNT